MNGAGVPCPRAVVPARVPLTVTIPSSACTAMIAWIQPRLADGSRTTRSMPMRTLAELACDPGCPVRRSMDALGGKWTLLIVRDLLVERRRFGELLITLGGISPRCSSNASGRSRTGAF